MARAGQTDLAGQTQIYEQVFMHPDGVPPAESNLAKGFTVSDDYLTYTIELKEGVKFHDGSELTASDVVYSWRRIAGSENSIKKGKIINGPFQIEHERDEDDKYVPGSLGVEAVGDYTVKVQLKNQFPNTLALLADLPYAVIPENSVGDIEGYEGEYSYDEFFSSEMIGTGPFQLDHWNKGSEISVTRFEEYHGEPSSVSGVTWTIMSDSNAIYNRAMNKEFDIFTLPHSQFKPEKVEIEEERDGGKKVGTYGPLRNGETVKYGETQNFKTDYILFNVQRVDERAVRRAFAYVMNQHSLAEDIWKEVGDPAYHIAVPSLYPGGPDAYENHLQKYPYGHNETLIEEAQKEMEEAGYGPNNRYSVTFTARSGSFWEGVAEVLRSKLASAYVDLKIDVVPRSTLITRASNGSMDVFSLGNQTEWPEPDGYYRFAVPSPFSWGQWTKDYSEFSKQSSSAWEKYNSNKSDTEKAQQARNEAYVTIEEANWAEVAILPVRHQVLQEYHYDWVDAPIIGPLVGRQYDKTTISNRK